MLEGCEEGDQPLLDSNEPGTRLVMASPPLCFFVFFRPSGKLEDASPLGEPGNRPVRGSGAKGSCARRFFFARPFADIIELFFESELSTSGSVSARRRNRASKPLFGYLGRQSPSQPL